MSTMDVKEIMEHIKPLTKKQKAEVVKQTIAMMAGKDPVFIALERWSAVYLDLKHCRYGGVRYLPADYRGMKSLLLKIRNTVEAVKNCEATDEEIVSNMEAYMRQVAAMRNRWYFDNRFTPAGLASDFEKLYATIKNRNDNGKNAFDYL